MKIYAIIGSIIGIVGYSVFYSLVKFTLIDISICDRIHYLSMYLSIGVVFFGFARYEKGKLLKYLVYIPTSGYFVSLVIIYGSNWAFDNYIQTNKPLLSFTLCTLASIIIYLSKTLKK